MYKKFKAFCYPLYVVVSTDHVVLKITRVFSVALLGPVLILKCCLTSIGFPIKTIRLIFIMEIAIPGKTAFMLRRDPDKPLSEAMLVSLLTHICVVRLQWVNYWANDDKWREWPVRGQAITNTNDDLLQNRPLRTEFNENWIKMLWFAFSNMHRKMLSPKW